MLKTSQFYWGAILPVSLIVLMTLFSNKPAIGEDQMKVKKDTVVVLETTQGNVEIKLYPDVAPKACENFVGLVNKGYYNGVIFHRVIKGFMIQGGDPTGTGRGGQSLWGTEFEDEVTPTVTFNRPGLVAMANRGPSTNGSQFFITTVPTEHLNMMHTIFGEVVGGMNNIYAIESTPVGAGDKPLTDQVITKAYVK